MAIHKHRNSHFCGIYWRHDVYYIACHEQHLHVYAIAYYTLGVRLGPCYQTSTVDTVKVRVYVTTEYRNGVVLYIHSPASRLFVLVMMPLHARKLG